MRQENILAFEEFGLKALPNSFARRGWRKNLQPAFWTVKAKCIRCLQGPCWAENLMPYRKWQAVAFLGVIGQTVDVNIFSLLDKSFLTIRNP